MVVCRSDVTRGHCYCSLLKTKHPFYLSLFIFRRHINEESSVDIMETLEQTLDLKSQNSVQQPESSNSAPLVSGLRDDGVDGLDVVLA